MRRYHAPFQERPNLPMMDRQHEGELARGSDWPGLEPVIEIANDTSDKLLAIAMHMQNDEDVVLPYQDRSYRFPKRFFLVHAIGHGTEHRTEVKVALAQIGVETPDLDGWHYAASAGHGQEVDSHDEPVVA